MPDVASLESQINVLKFQLSILGAGNPDSDKVKAQINALQQQLMVAKLRQGAG